MGLAVVAIVGAMGASVRHSAYTADRATTEVEARRIAEWVRSSAPLALCAPGGIAHYQTAINNPSTGAQVVAPFQATVMAAQYSVNGTEWFDFSAITGPPPALGCADAQRVVIDVRATATSAPVRVSIAKREP